MQPLRDRRGSACFAIEYEKCGRAQHCPSRDSQSLCGNTFAERFTSGSGLVGRPILAAAVFLGGSVSMAIRSKSRLKRRLPPKLAALQVRYIVFTQTRSSADIEMTGTGY